VIAVMRAVAPRGEQDQRGPQPDGSQRRHVFQPDERLTRPSQAPLLSNTPNQTAASRVAKDWPTGKEGEVERSHSSKYVEVLTMFPIRDL
jgi:hypothetical protein